MKYIIIILLLSLTLAVEGYNSYITNLTYQSYTTNQQSRNVKMPEISEKVYRR